MADAERAPAWPLEMDKVLRYSAALSRKPGFTLIDSFVGTCSWILRRFQFPPLPLPNPMLEALKASVLERQEVETREVTEAIGVPSQAGQASRGTHALG